MTIIYYQKIKQCVLDFIKSEPGKTLFILFLLIASFTYQHYGMSWDERQQRKTGMISFNYVFKGDDALLRWGDKDYGVGFELPLIIAEKTLKLKGFGPSFRLMYLRRWLVRRAMRRRSQRVHTRNPRLPPARKLREHSWLFHVPVQTRFLG